MAKKTGKELRAFSEHLLVLKVNALSVELTDDRVESDGALVGLVRQEDETPRAPEE